MNVQSSPRPRAPRLNLDQPAPVGRRPPLVRWGGALLAFLASLGVSLAVSSVTPPSAPFMPFFPAVIAAAAWSGPAPAALVAILSGLSAWRFFLTPGGPHLTLSAIIATGFFAVASATLIWLIDRLTCERRAHAAREAQLRAVMETAPIGIALYELPSGRLLEGSSHLEQMLKQPVAEAPDIHAYAEWTCYHADGSRVSPSEYPLARMMLENAEAPQLEAQYQRRDGARVWIRMMGRLIRNGRGAVVGGVIALVDVDAERRARQEAQRLADEFRTLADNMPSLCWMARPDGHIYWYNQRWYDYIGASPKTEGIGDEASVHDPAVLPRVRELWRRSLETGAPFEMTIPMKGADGVYRPFLTRAVAIRDEAGQITRWFGVNIEITEQKRHEQQQQLLINELNHRVKNTLATIQSIGAQTLGGDKAPREVFRNFESRLISLSEAHNLLTQRSWEGAEVGDIVERAARPFESPERVVIEAQGPAVWLKAESALGLAMALHELATNAVKHGALSTAEGRVAVRWSYDPATEGFQLSWSERGGPAAAPPTRRGFGLRLIERALAGETRAAAKLDFRPEGLVCTIRATLAAPVLSSAA